MAKKSDFQDGGRRHLEFYQFSIFGHVTVIAFNICCTDQISSKSDDFLLDIGDLAIFKMAAVRHLGFVITVTLHYCIAGHFSLSKYCPEILC